MYNDHFTTRMQTTLSYVRSRNLSCDYTICLEYSASVRAVRMSTCRRNGKDLLQSENSRVHLGF